MIYFLGNTKDKRIITRPIGVPVRFLMWVIFIISLGVETGALLTLLMNNVSLSYFLCGSIFGCLMWTFIFLGRIITLLIRLYQRYAPEHIRSRCMMMPSCSDYGIIAINRKGSIKGMIQTWKRLKYRCTGYYMIDFPV